MSRTSIRSMSAPLSVMTAARAKEFAVSIEYVSAGRGCPRGVSNAADLSGCRDFRAGAFIEPVAPVQPPASALLLGAGKERIRVPGSGKASDEGRLWIGWWVEKTLQMAAVRQHKGRIVAVDLGCLVDRLPRCDVIGETGDDIAVELDAPHVNDATIQFQPVWIDERIGEVEIYVVMMEARRQTGRIGVPKQNVERGRLVAEQIVVDPVIPDQIVGSHPCKHASKFLTVENAPKPRRLLCCKHSFGGH